MDQLGSGPGFAAPVVGARPGEMAQRRAQLQKDPTLDELDSLLSSLQDGMTNWDGDGVLTGNSSLKARLVVQGFADPRLSMTPTPAPTSSADGPA